MAQDAITTAAMELVKIRLHHPASIDKAGYLSLVHSCAKKNVHIFKNTSGRSTGYIAWARINADSLRRMVHFGEFPYFVHEWDEGYIALITDVCNNDRKIPLRLSFFKRLFETYRVIVYTKRSTLNIIYREKLGKSKKALFRRMSVLKR